jgi:hypothetical protein
MGDLIWSMWDGLRTAEFWGSVIGAAVGVLIGIFVSELLQKRRSEATARNLKHSICLAINDNRLAAINTPNMRRDNPAAELDYWKIISQPKPNFSFDYRHELQASPGALRPEERSQLREFEQSLRLIRNAWDHLRDSRAIVATRVRDARIDPERAAEGLKQPLREAFGKIEGFTPEWCSEYVTFPAVEPADFTDANSGI